MRQLLLDTNILHQEGLGSRSMKQLGRLSEAGKVEICVPTLVQREFLTRRSIESLETLAEMQRSLKELRGRVEHTPEARDVLAAQEAAVARLRPEIGRHIESSFLVWQQRNKVRELAFDANAMAAVIDDYFAGTGAFRKPKHRDDIIDSMIASSVSSLIAAGGEVFVAVKDGTFKRHLHSLEKVRVVDSVAEFLAIPEIQADLDALNESAAEWSKAVLAQLRDAGFQQGLRRHLLSDENDLLEMIYLEDDEVKGSEQLSVQPHWAVRLNGIAQVAETEIAFGPASHDSEGNFSLAVTVKGAGRLDYAAEYSDFYAAGDDAPRLTLESMKGDGACEVREVRQVSLTGYLGLSIQHDIRAADLLLAIRRTHVGIELQEGRAAIADGS